MSESGMKRSKTVSFLDATLSKSRFRITKAMTGAKKAWDQVRKSLSATGRSKSNSEYNSNQFEFGFLSPINSLRNSTKKKNKKDPAFLENFQSNERDIDVEMNEKFKLIKNPTRRDEVFDASLETYDAEGVSAISDHTEAEKKSANANSIFKTLTSKQSGANFTRKLAPKSSQYSNSLSEVSMSGSFNLKKLHRVEDLPVHEKDAEDKWLIVKALKGNLLFKDLNNEELDLILKTMELVRFDENQAVFTEGDKGDTFYIVRSGKLSMSKQGNHLIYCESGACFGESALITQSQRPATVTAVEESELFSLSRLFYRKIIALSEQERLESFRTALISVPLLKTLEKDQITEIAECVKLVTFQEGEQIIIKGTEGDTFYFIKSGSVRCTQIGNSERVKDIILHANDYFGERALLKSERRAANVFALEDVECLTLTREEFFMYLGSLSDLLHRNVAFRALKAMPLLHDLTDKKLTKLIDSFEIKEYKPGEQIIEQGSRNKYLYIIISGVCEVILYDDTDRTKHTKITELKQGEYFGESSLQVGVMARAEVTAKDYVTCYVIDVHMKKNMKLLKPLAKTIKKSHTLRTKMTEEVYQKVHSGTMNNDTILMLEELVHIKTLGTGTFGRVKLVEHQRTGNTYALKILQKSYVVQYKQQQNVLNEKAVMMKSDHPFILKLFRTFQSKNCLYFLLEYIPGGELFSLLHLHGGYMKPQYAQFYAACVLDAIVYLHKKQIVYRDLKPENLMIDAEGYIRLVDFGFAKKVTTRTYTLCGTPEYLAPESIQNKGHNRGVDYWAFGVLVYEMLAGFSPFSDFERNSQEEIFERILRGKFGFTSGFPKKAKDLVRKLLVKNFRLRLGMFKEGSDGIKAHMWFEDIDFDLLLMKKIESPWVPDINSATDTKHFDNFDEDDTEMPYKGTNKAWTNF